MFSETFRFLSMTRETLVQEDSSRRLALGVVLGMFIGLIPKDSLLAYFFFLMLMISTANLFSALIAGFVFNWIGYVLDPFCHKLGGMILTADALESTWLACAELPLMPWTRFNNTIVMGALVLSILIAYPVYSISYGFFRKYGAALHERAKQTRLYRWLISPPVNSNASHADA